MSKEEKLEKLLSEVARIADYANICHSMPGTSAHDTHYRYIETRLLKAIREYKAPPNTACTPTKADSPVDADFFDSQDETVS